jgi:hypothetical protein
MCRLAMPCFRNTNSAGGCCSSHQRALDGEWRVYQNEPRLPVGVYLDEFPRCRDRQLFRHCALSILTARCSSWQFISPLFPAESAGARVLPAATGTSRVSLGLEC